jgi:hemerythrin
MDLYLIYHPSRNLTKAALMTSSWTPALAVGIEIIDDQHKELFARFDQLMEAMRKGKGKQEVESVVNFLGEYVVTHFATEEKLMQAHQYPGYSVHKVQHTQFIQLYKDLNEKITTLGITPVMTLQIQKILGEWLVNHIGKQDQTLGAFLKTKP